MSDGIGSRFIERSRQLLSAMYMPKIERCMARLSDDEVWARANADSNSVGNLLLHLSGNVRQWIVGGLGGAPDVRQRQQEFDDRGPLPAAELLGRLKQTMDEADQVLARLDPESLMRPLRIQGRDVTALDAIYQVVEHFSGHTGQIISMTKAMKGDMGFYDTSSGTPRPTFLPAAAK